MEFTDRLAAAIGDRYVIERHLGEGGMAVVYLAHDRKHDRHVAVKVLRPEFVAAVGVERFLKEITVTANLEHPHILSLHDSGEADGLLYYVMPYLEGETLRDRINQERRLSIDDAIEITRTVASALDYAHRQGVIHRDIKPENILLQDGQAVVADFGIALASGEISDERLTETGVSLGTPQYMSPEQVMSDAVVDGRSDVYSLGAVLYEMLTGEPPHTGSSVQAVVARILSEPPTPVRHLRDTVPVHVEGAVARSLAKTPSDRFRTAAEFATAISQPAPPTVVPPTATTPSRRLIAAVVAMVAIGIVIGSLVVGRDPTIRSVAVLPMDNLSGSPEQDAFVHGMHAQLITELEHLSAFEKVIGRRSVMRFAQTDLSVPDIANALDVDALVEGSVLLVGSEVRINVGLIHAASERTLWSDEYHGDVANVLTLHREVTGDIARNIALTLTPQEEARLAEARSVDPEALDLFILGREQWNRRTAEGFFGAIESFMAAIAIDPTYAEAFAGLSDTYSLAAQYLHLQPTDAIPLARQAAERALELDTTLAEAYTSLGEVLFLQREWNGAETAYRRAVGLSPGYAIGHHFLGWFLSSMGRHNDAIRSLERARDLDPLSAPIRSDLASAFMYAGRYAPARAEIERVNAIQPGFFRSAWILSMLDILEGHLDDAIEAGADLGVDWWAGPLGEAHPLAAAGRESEARALIRESLATIGDPDAASPYYYLQLATVYVALGDYDAAIEWVERHVDSGVGAGPISLLVWPFFDPLRDDPRFIALVDRMGYPPP